MLLGVSMGQAKTLDEAELKRLLIVVSSGRHGPRNRLIILLGHWAGMRIGEIAALKVGDVVNSDCSIKDTINLTAKQTKGHKARTVHMPKRLQEEVGSFLKSLTSVKTESPLIHSQKTLNGFNANTLCSSVKGWYNLAGIDNGSSHSGRRTFLTKLATKGVSARVLQELAGHKNLATTQRYIDVNDEMKRKAIELIS